MEDLDELKQEAICADCVGDLYLQQKIKAQGEKYKCRYCGKKMPALTIDEIADEIEIAFKDHYSRTATEPDDLQYMMQKDPESDYSWEREGEMTVYAIMNAANISEEAASDIQQILAERHSDFDSAVMGEETEFDEDAYYEEIMPSDEEWQKGWRDFVQSIKSEARFFNRVSAEQLSALFDDIDVIKTQSGRPLIVKVGPKTEITHLFRARVFQSSQKLEKALMRPDLDLGAPPPHLASSGRMNAKGISTFYGATTAEIALAEVRPPVGSEVAVARFEITRPLQLLDLNALEDVHIRGSIFDPKYATELGRMTFLRSLCSRIARPIMPDDQEVEYLPTQAISDYLATEGKVPLDGILFPSVQAGGNGLNAVLFRKASRCQEICMPKGTSLSASTAEQYAEGWEREYKVIERTPPEITAPVESEADSQDAMLWPNMDELMPRELDNRIPALKVELDSIHVHVIEAVSFKSSDFEVTRYRWKSLSKDDEPLITI